MIEFYKYHFGTIKTSVFEIVISDSDYFAKKLIISIIYKKIKKIKILNVSLSQSGTVLDNNKMSEYQVLFNEEYKTIIENALEFHQKKYIEETLMHKIIREYKILEMFG